MALPKVPHHYTAYHFQVNPIVPGIEILIAELSEVEFESFVETEDGVTAYIPSDKIFENILQDIQILNSSEFEISFETEEIPPINWNEEWEKNFQPIEIEGLCHIRAPFHQKKDLKFDIVIEPKMSFGTGHHATTFMMAQYILKEDFIKKTVLDMGCGTGVLAILAEKNDAKTIDAIDIDNWCFQNTIENIHRNNCSKIEAYEGEANLLQNKNYDIILANINRNILLNDLPIYADSLNENGSLFLSGFYKEDLIPIKSLCEKIGLNYASQLERDGWLAVKFVK